jgi:hypothetical protein
MPHLLSWNAFGTREQASAVVSATATSDSNLPAICVPKAVPTPFRGERSKKPHCEHRDHAAIHKPFGATRAAVIHAFKLWECEDVGGVLAER